MLKIDSVCKTYRTGDLVQTALDHVSLCLRDSEFVAILGPSGSGKTTLLNVIGGLDRYDSGELTINGVSTRQYRDRDWDAYRNHSIGFVFQSYNLIPHQTILANVELALTISGIRRSERRRRAIRALEQVGLGDQLHKRPNQLSGGQMQRVAIARALVNDPPIVLADEPTGALDSETSLQVMELLRQVAKDRLVVMVTHNPELAERYATRVVRLRDGRLIGDSDPCEIPDAAPAESRRLGRASMSFGTALSLSFNNLRTKLGRTLLTAFAGSIGIIGIALILSMSNGVDHYIQSVQEDTLKSYPLEITDSSMDLTSLYAQADGDPAESKAEVTEWHTVTTLLSGVTSNDLTSLRAYFRGDGAEINNYVQAIEYEYGIKPRIFLEYGDSVRQVNPDNSFAAMGFSSTEMMSSLFSAFSSTDTFHPMPAEASIYESQYDLKAGHWPENAHECVLVLTARGKVSDLSLYTMGLKDPAELDALVRAFAAGDAVETDQSVGEYAYSDFLGLQFKLLYSADLYTYDTDFGVWKDRSEDESYLRSLLTDAQTLTIVGVVQPQSDNLMGALLTGICYPASLTDELIAYAADQPIVQAQLADREQNVITGKPFGEQAESGEVSMDSLISVDQDAIASLFAVDPSQFDFDAAGMDFSGMDLSGLDLSGMDLSKLAGQIRLDPDSFSAELPSLTEEDFSNLIKQVRIDISGAELQALLETLLTDYWDYLRQDPATDVSRLPAAISDFLRSDAAAAVLKNAVSAMLAKAGENVITGDQLGVMVSAVMAGYPAYLEASGFEDTAEAVLSYLQSDVAKALLEQASADLRAQFGQALPSHEDLKDLANALFAAYETYAAENALPAPGSLQDSLAGFLATEQAQTLLSDALSSAVDTSGMEQLAAGLFAGFADALQTQISDAVTKMVSELAETVTRNLVTALSRSVGAMIRKNMERLAAKIQENLLSAFTVDPEALASAFQMNMDMTELRSLVTALLSGDGASYAGNLRKLGYASPDSPTMITIYPTDFEGKAAVKQILEDYNELQRRTGNEDGVIVYTDMVDALMQSVTQIIDAISIVLIAFVAISLVVSSIMIGIITYISVLERTKEIGILRAIGASKRNISQVFNAETFLVGLCAGAMGVGVTLLLLIPINLLLRHLTGIEEVKAILPVSGAIVLVLLSMGLTLVAGLIPSRKAAKKDPVAALRSE